MTALKWIAALALSFAAFYAGHLLLVGGAVWLINRQVTGWVILLFVLAGWFLLLKVFSK